MRILGGGRFEPRIEEKTFCRELKRFSTAFEINSQGFVTGLLIRGLPEKKILAGLIQLKFLEALGFETFGDETRKVICDESMLEIVSNTNLKKVQFCNQQIPIESFSLLEALSLEALRVRDCVITDRHIRRIPFFAQIQGLTIAENPDISMSEIENLLSSGVLSSLVLTFRYYSKQQRESFECLGKSNGCQLMYIKDGHVQLTNFLGEEVSDQ